MAVFNFTNIEISENKSDKISNTGRAAGENFSSNIKRFPADLGSSDKNHYILINILSQTSPPITGTNGANQANIVLSGQQNIANAWNSIRNTIDSVLPSIGQFIPTANYGGSLTRISDTIALYMPNTLAFDYSQAYNDVSLTDAFGKIGAVVQIGATLIDAVKNKSTSGLGGALSPFLIDQIDKSIGAQGALFAAFNGGAVINPQLEMIYSRPSFRNFNFAFMFYPRSEKESNDVLDIIDLLRFYQAPEVSGITLIPPSKFEIEFHYNGAENINLPKIHQCVLKSIQTDYAPNGFHAYEVGDNGTPTRGGTGMPMGIRLTLAFTETIILTKSALNGDVEFQKPQSFANNPIG